MEGYKSRFGVGTLGLALGKLYTDPSVIYREYIQNACDGLELAIKKGLITTKEADRLGPPHLVCIRTLYILYN